MLRQRFKDADLIRSSSADTGSKSKLMDEKKRPRSANEFAHRRILSFDQSLEHQTIPEEDTVINYNIFTEKMHSKTLYDAQSKKDFLADPSKM